jgi:hypothetical protein
MAFLGALEHVREEDSPTRFLIKGGIACELRFQDQARATRDLDALFHGSLDELLADFNTAFAAPYSGFSFSYTPPEAVRETGAHRFDVKLAYEGRGWATLRVEISPPEGQAHEPEPVPALSISEFGLRDRPRSRAFRCDTRSHRRSTPAPSASPTVKTSASTT